MRLEGLAPYLSMLLSIPILLSCVRADSDRLRAFPEPPRAKADPERLEAHGHVRVDPYYWLRERDDPEVLAYLEAENAYTQAALAHTAGLQETLYQEIVGRIEPNDASVPYRHDGYYYYQRYVEGGEYPLYCRKRGSLEAEEEIMLDGNRLGAGHEFFSLRPVGVSSGGDLLAYAVDTVGRRFYTLHFKNLATGETLAESIPRVTGSGAWAEDNRTFLYTRQDPTTLRSYQVYLHAIGTDPATDRLVYEETDETFRTYVYKTKSKRYLVIGSSQTLSDELRILEASDPSAEPRLFLPRQRGHEYGIDHYGEHFYVRTNWEAENFRLMRTPVARTGREHWQEVIPHRQDVLLRGIEIFADHLVITERRDGLVQMRIRPWEGGEDHYLDFGEPAYLAFPSANPELDTRVLRYTYTSLTTPSSTYDYDMGTREKTLLKQDEVVGDFESANYRSERLHASARDGTRVPISLVYRVGTPRDGSRPLLLYGYGSYGASMDATFNGPRLSLLDRGFVFAIAHIRGGQELGRAWYEAGKLLHKKNTFTDFVDCAELLVAEGFTRPDRLFAMGGSAGGLLMGAIANLRPDLFAGVVNEVPFVDVVTTMLDETIPLTTSEYDEWGDPRQREYYDYMLSYSPYDNVVAKDYPSMLVTTGFHDSQVQYWEPAKYVAKLRATKTDGNLLLLYTNLEAGHGGATGRFKRHRETALAYAFLLDRAGLGGE